MLRYEPEYMRECINDGSDDLMMEYCALCLYELNMIDKKAFDGDSYNNG